MDTGFWPRNCGKAIGLKRMSADEAAGNIKQALIATPAWLYRRYHQQATLAETGLAVAHKQVRDAG